MSMPNLSLTAACTTPEDRGVADKFEAMAALAPKKRQSFLSVVLDARTAGFSWAQIWALFLEHGLPALIEIIKAILAGTKTKEEVLAGLPE